MEEINKDNFKEKVTQNIKPVIIDFYGDTCQPCKELSPILEKVSEKYKDKVFGLFDKLNKNVEGDGVGLALVKRIVEMHGGKVWIESEGDSKGTTFYFTVPPEIRVKK